MNQTTFSDHQFENTKYCNRTKQDMQEATKPTVILGGASSWWGSLGQRPCSESGGAAPHQGPRGRYLRPGPRASQADTTRVGRRRHRTRSTENNTQKRRHTEADRHRPQPCRSRGPHWSVFLIIH